MVGYNHSMEWTWNPYEPVHMESIWNGSFHVHSMSIPYGIHMEWRWNPYGMGHSMSIPCPFHMDSMCLWNEKMAGASAKVIPYGFHGMHMESIWIPYGFHMD